jgi:hypothetical protein
MSITMTVHIQNGTISVFGSDLELAIADATDKAVFDKIINAISSVSYISPVTNCNTHTDSKKEDEKKDKEEELKKAFEEMLGTAIGIALLSEPTGRTDKEKEVIKKLGEIFGQ